MRGKLYSKICDVRTLWQGWKRVKEKGAKEGIDDLTIEKFGRNLDRNLKFLSRMLEKEQYIPEPIKRIYIPKEKNGEKRSIALPSIKDKIVQEAVKTTVEPIFERMFLGCSYGFRPGKGPHRAIQKVEEYINDGKTWALCCDIDNFFDSINHELLLLMFSKKIWEKPILRLISLWLKMGIIDRTVWIGPEEGIPQGNVLSPLLSNVYLHPLDLEMTRRGYSYVRYADDFIIMCSSKEEAVIAFKNCHRFLQDELSVNLNFKSFPVKNKSQGFVFLGLLFKDNKRTIAESKFLKIQDRIKKILRGCSGAEYEELVSKLNKSIVGWKRYYGIGDVKHQFQFLDNFLFYNFSAALRRSNDCGDDLSDAKKALYGLELFIDRSRQEQRRFIKRIITRAKIKKIAKTEARLSDVTLTPLPVDEVVKKKKKEYERIFSRESDLVVWEPGCFVGKTSRRIVVRKKGKKIQEIPFFKVKNIIIISSGVSLSSNLIEYCMDNGIPVHFLDYKGKPYAMIHSPVFPLFKVSLQQLEATKDKRGIHLAASFVKGKIKNQINLLKYYKKYKGREVEYIEECDRSVDKMNSFLYKLKEIITAGVADEARESLFALEGHSASYYWSSIKNLLMQHVYFKGRERKGATDLVNSLLNYGYGILYSKVFEAILFAGLNPYISFLHKERIGKPTLVFDLIEEFRQAVVDKAILGMIKKNEKLEIKDSQLTLETRRKIAESIFTRLNSKVLFKGKMQSIGDVLRSQAVSLVRFIQGKGKYKPFIDKW